MGRTLDILKQTRGNPLSLKIASNLPPIPSPTILPLPESAEEVPFIEVGGPNHALQGSAGVLAQSDRRPKMEDRGSKIEDRGSKIEDQGRRGNQSSTIFHPQSSILDPPSPIPARNKASELLDFSGGRSPGRADGGAPAQSHARFASPGPKAIRPDSA